MTNLYNGELALIKLAGEAHNRRVRELIKDHEDTLAWEEIKKELGIESY